MIFLVEFDVHDGDAPDKLYVSTHGVRSGPTDTPANQYYAKRMRSVGHIERSMFGSGDGVSSGTTGGASEVGFGNISVLNGTSEGEDDLIDYWKDLAFRQVVIKSLGQVEQPFSSAVTRFIGSVEQLVSTNALEQYDMIIHDRLKDLDKPLLINTYLGTTVSGGLFTAEGDVDQKDAIKQKVWGTVHNLRVTPVNNYDLAWQVSDGPVFSIAVYDGGVGLTNDGDVGTLEAMFAVAMDGGHYVTCNALGLFRTAISPVGTVTADVVEGATATDRSAAQIVRRMLLWFAEMYDEAVTLSTSDVVRLDALNPAQCGIVVRDTENALDAIMRVLNSVGAWMLPQSNSATMFNVGRFDPPDDEPVASYDLDDNIGGTPQRVESGDSGKGVPAWKVTVRYDQLDTVQASSDLFGEVTENDPVRVAYLATEWRQASVEDEDVLEQWPNAPAIEVTSRLLTQADAAAEAERLLDMHGAKRDIWRIVVPLSENPQDDPGVGEVVELTSRGGRMGLGPEAGLGSTFRCLGRIDDFDDVPLLTLTLWGPFPPIPVVIPISGAFAANELGDLAQFTASIPLPVTGTLVATDAVDTASITGTVTAALDSDVSAYVAAVTSAGGSVSSGRQTLLNNLVTGLKTDGVWAKLDRLWPYGSENSQSALIDLKTRATATLSTTAPAFTVDRGYQGNGASAYIDSGLANNWGGGSFSRNSACVFVWNNTAGIDGGGLVGTGTTVRVVAILPEYTDSNCYTLINGDSGGWSFIFANAGATGLYLANRTSATAVTLDINGTQVQSSSTDSSFALTADHFTTLVAAAGGGWSGRQCSCMGLGGGLTAGDRVALYNRLRTYMTAIGVP